MLGGFLLEYVLLDQRLGNFKSIRSLESGPMDFKNLLIPVVTIALGKCWSQQLSFVWLKLSSRVMSKLYAAWHYYFALM